MNQHYEPELRKNIVKLHLEAGRSLRSFTEEYKVSKQPYHLKLTGIVKNAAQFKKPNRLRSYEGESCP